jgi:GT2 family glycosyltransferase
MQSNDFSHGGVRQAHPAPKKIYAVILAWNHWDDTQECIESLLAAESQAAYVTQLIIVDNGSTDDTVTRCRARYPSVHVISLDKNYGINVGYNAGMQYALDQNADYVMIMNNDTWAHPDMTRALFVALENDAQIGAATPKIVHYSDPTLLWHTGAHWRAFPPEVKMDGYVVPDSPAYATQRYVEFATTCCLLIRAETLRRVGLFDASYEFYFDDWDFSLRVRRGGYEMAYVPSAILKHKVSISTQNSDKPARWYNTMGRDSVLYYTRNVSRLSLWIYTAWVVMRDLALRRTNRIKPYLQGVRRGLSADSR